ncbi:hypothetical protein CFI00_07135 [Nocardioides sp. S5]|uniref:hypothetical protein n=1 Tax=Nocardioides sp. S5 TaxID=2017486 RepID=UPI001A904090|nr:hypothetical protein [Nocardioides sp. S5]QSR30279.1 hypothetical protein CFI00_07135 [Nocardioides sp. S5]
MNPIRLVSGAVTLPAHVAAAVVGASVGVATTGARATAHLVGRAIERASGPAPVPNGPWSGERAAAQQDDPILGTRVTSAEVTDPMSASPAAEAPVAEAVKKAPVRRAPARKKTPARKKAPSKKAAVMAPALGLTEAEVEDVLRTPSGIPAAGDGTNPDTTETDLHQPGIEPLMDPATVKSVKSESEVLRRAADTDKG